jgi:hypothetical protein
MVFSDSQTAWERYQGLSSVTRDLHKASYGSLAFRSHYTVPHFHLGYQSWSLATWGINNNHSWGFSEASLRWTWIVVVHIRTSFISLCLSSWNGLGVLLLHCECIGRLGLRLGPGLNGLLYNTLFCQNLLFRSRSLRTRQHSENTVSNHFIGFEDVISVQL